MKFLGRAPEKIRLFKLVHPAYVTLRRVLTATGLFGPLRSWLGPRAGLIVSRITGDPSRPSLIQGHKMMLAHSGGYPPIAMAMDRYERETTHLFESLIKPGMVVIDVGAHVGYYSLLAARLVGAAGKVFAFEPEEGNHELLLGNINRNGYSNIVAIRKAVSNRVGSTTLYLTALDNGRHSAYQHGLPDRGSAVVEATTLDAFLDAQGWPKVDLVKVDVEGAEQDVFQGMERLLRESPDLKLIVEFSPALLQHAAGDPFQFLQWLSARHFEVHCIDADKGPVAIPNDEWPSMVDTLLKTAGSINLFCTRS